MNYKNITETNVIEVTDTLISNKENWETCLIDSIRNLSHKFIDSIIKFKK